MKKGALHDFEQLINTATLHLKGFGESRVRRCPLLVATRTLAPSEMPSYWTNFATAAAGPALACVITNPADVAKTRLNLERELKSTEMSRTTSSVRKMQQTYAAEGIAGLQRGLQLAMVREASKNTFRIGLYQPLVDLGRGSSSAPGPAPFAVLMPAAMASGAISALLTNPLDLLKTRLQLDGGHARGATASTSARSIASAIVVEEGGAP